MVLNTLIITLFGVIVVNWEWPKVGGSLNSCWAEWGRNVLRIENFIECTCHLSLYYSFHVTKLQMISHRPCLCEATRRRKESSCPDDTLPKTTGHNLRLMARTIFNLNWEMTFIDRFHKKKNHSSYNIAFSQLSTRGIWKFNHIRTYLEE